MGDFYTITGTESGSPGARPRTLALLLAGATKRVWLHEVHIGSTSASALAGTRFSVGRPTTSGTGGAAYTPVPVDAAAPAAIFTALSSSTIFSAEPTQPASYIWSQGLDAVASYVWVPKSPIVVGISTRLALRIESEATPTIMNFTLICEE